MNKNDLQQYADELYKENISLQNTIEKLELTNKDLRKKLEAAQAEIEVLEKQEWTEYKRAIVEELTRTIESLRKKTFNVSVEQLEQMTYTGWED